MYPFRLFSRLRRTELRIRPLALCIAMVLVFAISARPQWRQLDDGLELGSFKATVESPAGDSVITVLRIDPQIWEFRVLSTKSSRSSRMATAREWCQTFGLTAAINAGMYNADYRTHTGYMRCGSDVNNASRNSYKSLVAFSPVDTTLPPFRIFDLDSITIDSMRSSYSCLVQNLRLIDRSRRNRWSEQPKQWSEAALGEDSQGRALFIFCRSPYSMYTFNRILLSLPLDLVCAQHLEGGPVAQFYLNRNGSEMELVGSYETGVMEDDPDASAWPIPNVLGIVRRP
jgi:hypothetical protein